MRSIEINIKEWRDKTHGNTYFSAQIVINTEKGFPLNIIYLPFQYGDYLHAEDLAIRELLKIPEFSTFKAHSYHFNLSCEANGYHYSCEHTKGNLKKYVVAFGKP